MASDYMSAFKDRVHSRISGSFFFFLRGQGYPLLPAHTPKCPPPPPPSSKILYLRILYICPLVHVGLCIIGVFVLSHRPNSHITKHCPLSSLTKGRTIGYPEGGLCFFLKFVQQIVHKKRFVLTTHETK